MSLALQAAPAVNIRSMLERFSYFRFMKYSICEIINKPLEDVVAKFDNEDGLKHWMRGLQSIEHIEGDKGKAGAVSIVKFDMGKRKFEMKETILENNLPETMSMTYDAPGVHNIVVNKFKKIDESSTEYVTEQEFKFKSFAMKFFGWVMPGAFKKQSKIYMDDFKNYVENNASVLDQS